MGSIISVFSAKGGVGKSIIVTNLGVAYIVGHRKRTVVVDLQSGLGCADLLLDLQPDRTWRDLQPVIDEITPKHIQLAVTNFRPGLDILACPPKFSWDPVLRSNGVTAMLSALREEYEVVLVDTATGGGGINKRVYTLSDVRMVVLTPDAPALRATGRYLSSAHDEGKITGLVINQYRAGAAVSPQEIQEHLGKTLFAVLPVDPSGVWSNVSYGEPCVLRKNSKLGKSLRELSTRTLRYLDQDSVAT